ncbi:hypothetical protein [Alkalihalobacillus deserti]|uniref:hypothetical protein n=1 Tax=Alkalihalobacillus deserti TaxID=2879466 RepID=UPI001D13C1BC|nr:hypothetical protein [Alkalihalobacillus deserti]
MRKLDIPIAAFILSFILAPMIEKTLIQSLSISQTGGLIFFSRPISGTIMVIAILIFIFSIVMRFKKAKPDNGIGM